MYAHFTYFNGSNPYITTTPAKLWDMVQKYELTQTGATCFHVEAENPNRPRTYADKKDRLRDFAIDWQCAFSELVYSWGDLSEWGAFFEEYGRKFGLLKEFRENAIC